MQRSVDGAVLEIAGLCKAYGSVQALDGIDLSVSAGEIVGLLGPNGAGKTTMVSIVCGLRRADSGDVSVNGVDALAQPHRARRHIGLAPQELGIYPIDRVRQNLAFFGEMAGLRGKTLAAEIETVAAALRLDALMDRKAGELSGGQKRRLHTAIALLDHPPLILLDEATTGADVESRSALIDVVKGLARRGSAVLYSTHYLEEVGQLEARVVILDSGQVIADGAIPELVRGYGGAVVELAFEGDAPALGNGDKASYEGSIVRILVDDPGRDAARILGSLGRQAERLSGIEMMSPSLETVFLSLTGRRYDPKEVTDVVAS